MQFFDPSGATQVATNSNLQTSSVGPAEGMIDEDANSAFIGPGVASVVWLV